MKETLIVFSRYPEPGKTKTRMIPALGAKGAAKLQKKLSEHTLKQAKNLSSFHPVNIDVYFTGGSHELMETWLGRDLAYFPQATGDLGKKMYSAFNDAALKQQERAIIIGIDCPGITPQLLDRAFNLLTSKEVVLGEAADGGYYLIGLSLKANPPLSLGDLFKGIDWGTGTVFQQTLDSIAKLKLSSEILPVLRDMDRPEDLDLLTLLEA